MGVIKSTNAPAALSPFSMKDIENQARAILLRARQQAEQLLTETQTEAETLRTAAHAQGMAEGRKEGLAKGAEEGRKSGHQQALTEHRVQLTNLIKGLSGAMSQLDASRRELESQALREVVELAIAVARRVTKRQGLVDPAVLSANLAEAMKLVVLASDVHIAINPVQRMTLEDALPRLQMDWPSLQHVQLIDDPALAPGGCRIITQQGQVDGDLDGQLDRVVNELLPISEEAA